MPSGAKVGHQHRQHVGGRDVEVGRGADVEHDHGRRDGPSPDEGIDLVLRDVGVDERQGHVRADDQEAVDRDGLAVPLGVGVHRGVGGDPSEDGDVRPARLVQDRQQ